MTFTRTLLGTAAATALLAFGTGAHAALTMTTPACTASILTPTYTACGGSFDGNNKNQSADVNAYIASTFGSGYTVSGSSDDAGTFGPFTSNPTGTTGTLTFDSSIDGAFVLALKAADQFSLFYYDGAGPAISSINFSTLGVAVNSSGIPNGLSHATLYAGPMTPPVPEPETYALMLGGLGLVGWMARRRQRG